MWCRLLRQASAFAGPPSFAWPNAEGPVDKTAGKLTRTPTDAGPTATIRL
ncbi:MAG: hypothetical protein ABSG78_23120 [Verrucomicrobiota bacterium]